MASSYPMLRYGSSGQEVRRLQQALNRAGYSLEVDGGFGEKTRAALMDYQRRAGMTPDGVAGSKTWASLGLQSAQDRLADLEKGYTPSRETQEARRSWEELAARQPGDYTSPYADRMEDLLRQMESREAFSYDPSRDEMFRRYARLYQRQGQTAMEDTLGQAAGLTGGYDSSYARQAGQQEYNRYMQELAELMPELESSARQRDQDQRNWLTQRYERVSEQEQEDYKRYRQEQEAWQESYDRAGKEADALREQEYADYKLMLQHYTSKANAEQKASGDGRANSGAAAKTEKKTTLSSTAMESLRRAMGNYLKGGKKQEAAALAQRYGSRMTAMQKKQLKKLFGTYGANLII